ncbi:MAG: AMP-binding protein [Betaproteobacteria bacterium]
MLASQDDTPHHRHCFAPRARVEHACGGATLVRAALALPAHATSLGEMFTHSARRYPERVFMRERDALSGGWIAIPYSEALQKARAIAQWLLDDGAVAGQVLVLLSGASIEHALMALGAQLAGVTVAPVSVGYSTLSTDFERLKTCVANVGARYVFAADPVLFGAALKALRSQSPTLAVVLGRCEVEGLASVSLGELLRRPGGADLDRALAAVGPRSIAKLMFTSGSTGAPKAAPQTQDCMTVTVAQAEAVGLLEFGDDAPQLLEAMPFSHIMAGNFNFNNMVRCGGTINLDEGNRPPRFSPRPSPTCARSPRTTT